MTALVRPARPYPYADVVAKLRELGACTVSELAYRLPYHEGTVRSKLYGAQADGVVDSRKRGASATQEWYVVG